MLRFGPSGRPSITEGDIIDAIKDTSSLNLSCLELAFVRNVYLKEESALEVKKASKKNNVTLTCHGQYFINLNSLEKAKIEASKKRILHAANRAWQAGAWSITFHAAYYMKQDPKKVYNKVKIELKDILHKLNDIGNDIWVRPEISGKKTQFGNLKELISLSQEFEQVLPCIDFAHLHARTNGLNNTYDEFCDILSSIEEGLGREALDNMHIHISGIAYNDKGERHHLPLKESDFNYIDLVKSWKDFKINGCVISESPNLEKDALLLKSLI